MAGIPNTKLVRGSCPRSRRWRRLGPWQLGLASESSRAPAGVEDQKLEGKPEGA